MQEKREWVREHTANLSRMLISEPRGHADLCGAVLTEPISPGAHAGVLFFHNDGYSAMSGHGIMCVARIAIDRGLIMPGGDGSKIVFDTVSGSVAVTVDADRVSFVDVPAYVIHAGVPVKVGSRSLRADIAWSGEPYAIVDAESVGIPVDGAHVPELRLTALVISDAVTKLVPVSGVIFTGPAYESDADLRTVGITSGGVVDRSPCGFGTSAVMAVIDAMGLLDAERPFVHEGLIRTRVEGRLLKRTTVQDTPAIVTEITGSAWITGDHTFAVDERDPLKLGFRI
jgi:proline racemase